MFFLFGWGHRTTNDQGPTVPLNCRNCHNDTWLHLFSYRTWFTAFFIPLIPYESKSLLLCPICSHGIALSGDAVERYRTLNTAATALREGRIDERAFLAAAGQPEAGQVAVSGGGALPELPRLQAGSDPADTGAAGPRRATRYAAANVCLMCRDSIGRGAAKEEVTFIHDDVACCGYVHTACAGAFRQAMADGEAGAIFARHF